MSKLKPLTNFLIIINLLWYPWQILAHEAGEKFEVECSAFITEAITFQHSANSASRFIDVRMAHLFIDVSSFIIENHENLFPDAVIGDYGNLGLEVIFDTKTKPVTITGTVKVRQIGKRFVPVSDSIQLTRFMHIKTIDILGIIPRIKLCRVF